MTIRVKPNGIDWSETIHQRHVRASNLLLDLLHKHHGKKPPAKVFLPAVIYPDFVSIGFERAESRALALKAMEAVNRLARSHFSFCRPSNRLLIAARLVRRVGMTAARETRSPLADRRTHDNNGHRLGHADNLPSFFTCRVTIGFSAAISSSRRMERGGSSSINLRR